MAGSTAPQRTIEPNTSPLSSAAAAMTAAAATGRGRRQATGRVMARIPMEAAAPPCG